MIRLGYFFFHFLISDEIRTNDICLKLTSFCMASRTSDFSWLRLSLIRSLRLFSIMGFLIWKNKISLVMMSQTRRYLIQFMSKIIPSNKRICKINTFRSCAEDILPAFGDWQSTFSILILGMVFVIQERNVNETTRISLGTSWQST